MINYSYFIQNDDSPAVVIVDPAWEPEKIREFIYIHGFDPVAIFVTHSHPDHSHLAGPLAGLYDCKVYMSEKEAAYYDFRCNGLNLFRSEESITAGGLTVKPIFTPGHTAGSCCYLIENVLFTGDTLFIEGCGLCEGPGADPEEMYYSLRKLKATLRADTLIYPGHRFRKEPGLPFEQVIPSNIYLQIDNPQQFISYRMRKNQASSFKFI